MNSRFGSNALSILSLAVLWEVAGRAMDSTLIPPLSQIAAAWWKLLSSGKLLANLSMSLTTLAVGFLLVPFLMDVDEGFLRLTAVILLAQAFVGLAGLGFHAQSVLRQPAQTVFERILSGAPLLAPLLFPNLVGLALIALWVLRDVNSRG